MTKCNVIYGPPGTGKSTEIIRRVKEHLLNGVTSSRIGLCSFTRAAAQVLSERAAFKSRYIGTIHSLAFRQADIIREQVINYRKLKEFEEISGVEISGVNPDEAEDNQLKEGDHYLALYGLARARCETNHTSIYIDSDQPGTLQGYLFFVEAYETFKKENGYVDYNDMLERALKRDPLDLDVLFIDEAQDLSKLQWALIRHWMPYIKEVHVSGDDDQSIYEWGGAERTGMYDFETEFKADRVVLDQSWRIPISVHKKALNIQKYMGDRVDKAYKPREGKGKVEYYSDLMFLDDFKNGDDVLILYRNHSLRKEIEERLIENNTPYVTDNGRPGVLEGWYADTVQLYDTWKANPNEAFTPRELAKLKSNMREIHKLRFEANDILHFKDLTWCDVYVFPHEIQTYLEEIYKKYKTLDIEPTIHLSSIHGAKGREAHTVVLLNSTNGLTAMRMQHGDQEETEARVFYVGVTRAKERLVLVDGVYPVDWLVS